MSQCHSDYNKAAEVNEHGHHVPQCGFDGSYKQTQCNRESGECWCVDKNGKEKPETRTTEMPQCQLKGMLGLIFVLSLPFYLHAEHENITHRKALYVKRNATYNLALRLHLMCFIS